MNSRDPKLKFGVLQIYAQHVLKYPWYFGLTILSSIGMTLTALVAPLYLRTFFNLVAGEPTPERAQQVLFTLGIIILIWGLDWLVNQMRYIGLTLLEVRVMSDLSAYSFKYLLSHSYNFFISQFAGSLTHKVSKFTRAFEVLYDALINSFLPTTFFISGAVWFLYSRSHILGIILAFWSVAFVLFQIYMSRVRKPARIARSEADSKVVGNLADAISNQPTVALFSGFTHEHTRFAATVSDWGKAVSRAWLMDTWIWAGVGLFILVIEGALFFVGTRLWQQGLFTVGDFVLVQAYLLTAFNRLEALNRELRRTNDSYSDASELVDILNTPYEVYDAADAKDLIVTKGEIQFRDVTFGFNSGKAVLENLDLSIHGAEKVAFVGPSGAGKSTITKLILRFYDVLSGAVTIDDQDIRAVTQNSLRDAIAFVPQEPILFHRTLMENIRYGRRNASDEEVIAASKKARCHEFIMALPQRYDTYVGERGVKLSGGERQRVAIARAILKNAPILILDEATSSLDSASEVMIQDALTELMEGKTVLVVAHRLSTIMKMDRIVVLKNGAIEEEGTHAQLLEHKRLYAELWGHQAGGFLQDEE